MNDTSLHSALANNDSTIREQCLNIEQSFIVQAPAGSGKTELLSLRILTLLGVVDEPEAILAITFTKKAAAEMRSRIIASLERAATLNESLNQDQQKQHLAQLADHERKNLELSLRVLARDQERNWLLLENPNRLQVKTIDSFCSGVVYQLPILSGLGGKLKINDNADELYQQASKNFLKSIEQTQPWTSALKNLYLELDKRGDQLTSMFSAMLARRLQWLPLVIEFHQHKDEPAAIKAHMEAALTEIFKAQLNQITSHPGFKLLNDLDQLIPFCSQNVEDDSELAVLRSYSKLSDLNELKADQWQAISSLLLTKEGCFRSTRGINKKLGFPSDKTGEAPEKKQSMQKLLAALSEHPTMAIELHELSQLPHPFIGHKQIKLCADICECLYTLLGYLELSFQENQSIDFPEIQIRATQTLDPSIDIDEEQAKPALLSLDAQIDHILVDEYQDTSNSQLQLLKHLISQWQYQQQGKTLFLVGDPMQSIYRFREANVSIFLQAQNRGVENIELEALTLTSNFRSEPGIVNWVNDTFQNSFPKKEDYLSGAISYSHSKPFVAPNLDNTNNVEYHFSNKTNSGHAENDLVNSLADRIEKIRSNNPEESIAVLLRSKNRATNIIQALKDRSIAYQGLEIDLLSSCPHIHTLLNLSGALLHYGDNLSWLALMRSPLIGLSNPDLFALKQYADQLQAQVGEVCLTQDQKILEQLSDNARQLISRAQEILALSIKTLETQSFAWTLESCWLNLGGPASIKEDQLRDCQNFFSLVRKLEQKYEYISLKRLSDASEALFAEPQVEDNNPVLIMSIHKSKGLEFDHVFLPHLDKGSQSDTKQLLNWNIYETENDTAHLLLAPLSPAHEDSKQTQLYDYLSNIEKKKANNESVRLFYVAATRAKRNLYLYAELEREASNESDKLWVKPASRSLLAIIWDHIDLSEVQEIPKSNTSENADTTKPTHYRLKRLAPEWQNIDTLNIKDKPAIEEKLSGNAEQQSLSFLLQDRDENAIRGSLFHRVLKQYAESDEHSKSCWSEPKFREQFYPLWSQYLEDEQALLSQEKRKTLLRDCSRLMDRVISDSQNQWIFDHRLESAECELSCYYSANKIEIKNYVIDRTFIYENKRWIIDYKSSEPKENQSTSDFLNEQKALYRKQLNNYSKVFSGLEDNEQILAIYFPSIQSMICWEA